MTTSVANTVSNSPSIFPTTSRQTWKTSGKTRFALFPVKVWDGEGNAHWAWLRRYYSIEMATGTLIVVPFRADPKLPEYFTFL